MSIIAMRKVCPFCGKEYDWDPDVGRIWCPRCGTGKGKDSPFIPLTAKKNVPKTDLEPIDAPTGNISKHRPNK